ncbi:MAG: DNA mismatch repair endonuclease MutL [Anaerolineales bacterium]|nr:DNA mismatch repair endonuclease MutL [Anaerolineales bacterium]
MIRGIAAGEVVERPASVVKELIENALDAGARTITVTLEGGGRNLIRVADDGSGIPAAEVELAFARHATSKLATADDLFQIHTLGFRGEALASIASVSRVGVMTRAAHETTGTQLRLEGTQVVSRAAIGAPQGTVVSVENLFYNVPARLKFLKSETAERSHVAGLISRYAIAYPAVRWKLMLDNRTAFQSTGSGEVREVLVNVYGVEIARQLIEINTENPITPATPPAAVDDEDDLALREPRGEYAARRAIHVKGFISPPALNRSNRKDITLFVNGRWVQDIRLSTAVLQAYHTMLMVGRYPLAVIQLTLPPEEVDVNVHPTKAEVRFRSSDAAFTAVERTVRKALMERAPVPQFEIRQWSAGADDVPLPRPSLQWSPEWGMLSDTNPNPQIPNPNASAPPAPQLPITPANAEQPALPATDVPLLRVVGQIGAAYIVAEGPDGLYLIDQHAAHERILYEAFSLQRAAAQIVSQALLEPAVVEVPPAAASLLISQMAVLNQIGFSVEQFGGNQFIVRSLPTVLGNVDPAKAVRVLVEDFEEDETPLQAEVEARLIARVCKRAAVRAGQTLTGIEMNTMVRQLERCQSPRTCPHGRPTMIYLSVDTLEKQFGRKG